MPTNDHDLNPHKEHGHGARDAEHPGYEVTDVNVSGVVVFLSGLVGFLLVFFVFCFVMGKVINNALEKEDGPLNKWNQTAASTTGGKRKDLASNPEMQQKELQQLTAKFPEPRLDIDDGNQSTADLHAREDLLLDHYSVGEGENKTIRIPIDRAMAIVARRGLPLAAMPAVTGKQMAGDEAPVVQAPLTSGFARTGFELDVIEAREQKLNYGKAEGASHAELAPAK